MRSPLVSVIIPVFNGDQFIGETIDSVIGQSYRDLEVLVIDDGSDSKLKEIIQPYCDKDRRIRYYYQDHQGVSKARNYGIRLSQGSYLAFLDADDVWMEDNLWLKVPKLEGKSFGMVHSDALLMDKNSQPVHGILRGREGWLLDDLLIWKTGQVPGPSSVLVKKEVIDRVGMFDENLSTAADRDFFIRVSAHYEIGRIEKPTWKYRVHDANMHKNISLMEKDTLYLYGKLSRERLFRSWIFKKRCFANMYRVLAASWRGDGQNSRKFLYFISKAILSYPPVIFPVTSRAIRKWRPK